MSIIPRKQGKGGDNELANCFFSSCACHHVLSAILHWNLERQMINYYGQYETLGDLIESDPGTCGSYAEPAMPWSRVHVLEEVWIQMHERM